MNNNHLAHSPRLIAILLFSLFAAFQFSHGEVEGEQGASDDSTLVRASFEGVRIDSIAIETEDVFDTDDPTYDRFAYRAVNWFHIQTRPMVVRTEILFKVGEQFSWSLAEETERNIRARCDVYTAEVIPVFLDDGRLLVRVRTVDQWSIAGGINFRKEGDAFEYDLGFKDDNLFGFNHRIAFEYVHPTEKSDYVSASYEVPRLQFAPLQLSGWGTTNSEGKGGGATISKPFFSRLQRLSFLLQGSKKKGTVSFYDDSVEVAAVDIRVTSATLAGFYRFGSLRDKFMIGAFYNYVYDAVGDSSIYTKRPERIAEAEKLIPSDSNYHEVGIGFEVRRIDYMKTTRIDRSRVVEDFTLGPALVFTASKPFGNGDRQEQRYSLGVGYTGYHFKTMFLMQHLVVYGFDNSEQIRKTASYAFRCYNRSVPWMTSVLHARFLEFDLDTEANGLGLGGFSGLRGYPQRFLTGNRVGVLSSELRFFSGLELVSIELGASLFADAAGCWKDGQSLSDRETYASLGAGLRFFAKRIAGGATFRVDASYSEKYGTQISVGTGQYFSAKAGEIGLTIR